MALSPVDPTFLGQSFGTVPADHRDSVVVLGVPVVTPYGPEYKSHAASGPAAIRDAMAPRGGLEAQYDFDLGAPITGPGAAPIVDIGDLVLPARGGAENREAIRAMIHDLRGRGSAPLVLGGDDSLQIPVIDGLSSDDALTVVQVDAHIDWRDERFGERYGYSSPMRRASEMPHVAAMVQIGIRGTGSARQQEVDDAIAWGSEIVTMREVRCDGIGAAIHRIPEGRPCVLALDCDGLDTSVIPGVAARAPGGLGYGDMVELMHGAAERGRLVGCSIVELWPERDPSGMSARAAGRLAALAAGLMARGF